MPLLEGIVAGVIADRATAAAVSVHDRVQAWRRADDPVADAFDEALAKRIEGRAETINSLALSNVANQWSVVTADIDTYGTVFASEAEAIDWLVAEVADHEAVDISDDDRTALREIIADEYANATAALREQAARDKALQQSFQTDLGVAVLDRFNAMRREFQRIADPGSYTLYEFPADREAIIEALFPNETIPFASRPEVPADPVPERRFVIGPSGAGKSRLIAQRVERLSDDAVDYVLVPDQRRFLSQEDARALGRRSFDGDLMLVWEDLHKVEQGQETRVVERTLAELENAVSPEGELYTLLEARSGRLDDVPGTFPSDFDNDASVWGDFNPLWTGTMPEESLRQMLRNRVAASEDVELNEEAADALVERISTAESAPRYIETVVNATDGPLTVGDVEALPDTVAGIWREQVYPDLRENAPTEWDSLVAMKLLYDLNVPAFSKLVYEIYLNDDLVGGDPTRFRTAVERLAEARGWLTVVTGEDEDLLAPETLYLVHDTQLEAVSANATDRLDPLAALLSEDVGSAVPASVHGRVHFYAGTAFYQKGAFRRAEEQWSAAIREDPELSEAHYNYANLLSKELDDPEEAAGHYERAIQINPEYAQAHSNYATLLKNELDDPEEAADHYERAIQINPELSEAHYNYANLLSKELDDPEEAADHYERAIQINPEYAQAHSNYATLLKNELDDPEEAADHYERAIQINPELSEVHYNYANLLKNELDDPEEAADHYERAIQINPEYAQAHSNYATLLKNELDDPEEAADHYERAIQVNPELSKVHYNYATLLKNELDDPEEAADHYERAIQINPELSEAHYNYATLLKNELDDPEEAADHYERAIQVNPELSKVHYNYATLLKNELDDPEEAADHYERAIQINPELSEAHYNYATLLLQEFGRYSEAKTHLETSVSLWFDVGNVQNALNDIRTLVRVCLTLGDWNDAVEHCERSLEILDTFSTSSREDRLWFESMTTAADPATAETEELVVEALNNVMAENLIPAAVLFEVVWERGAEQDVDTNVRAAAGTALAAILRLLDIPESSYKAAELLDKIDPDNLVDPETVLFTYLSGDDPDRTGEDLLSQAREFYEDDKQFSAFQWQAFGILLSLVQSQEGM